MEWIKKIFELFSLIFICFSVLTMIMALLGFVPFLEWRILRAGISAYIGYYIVTSMIE